MKWTIVSTEEFRPVASKFAFLLEDYGVEDSEGALSLSFTDPGSGHRIILGYHESDTPEEYRIRVEHTDGCNIITVTGSDYNGVLYGYADFVNRYLPYAENSNSTFAPYYFHPMFTDAPMKPYDVTSSPKVARRGLWTWGHVLRDPEGYFGNMVKCKMNTCVIWNNGVPANAKKIVAMAHKNGIKLLWGYAWGWSTNISAETMEEHLNHKDDIVREYEEQYAPLGADGIYFQSFTEVKTDKLGGRLIAEVVTEYVNDIAGKILEKHPTLTLQFGLHATSVQEKLEYIAKVDPRVEIVWEDCGAFPYAYVPTQIENFDKTLDVAQKMSILRGQDDRFGSVYKGLCCLNWMDFKYPAIPYTIGDDGTKSFDEHRTWVNRYVERSGKIMHYVQAHWLENAEYCRRMTAMLEEEKKGDLTLLALVEDSAFEYRCWFPVLVLGEILWNPHQETGDILRDMALSPVAAFA